MEAELQATGHKIQLLSETTNFFYIINIIRLQISTAAQQLVLLLHSKKVLGLRSGPFCPPTIQRQAKKKSRLKKVLLITHE